MKAILIITCLAFASCNISAPAEWQGTPNPLDTPSVPKTAPESMGRFGPHSEFYY